MAKFTNVYNIQNLGNPIRFRIWNLEEEYREKISNHQNFIILSLKIKLLTIFENNISKTIYNQ